MTTESVAHKKEETHRTLQFSDRDDMNHQSDGAGPIITTTNPKKCVTEEEEEEIQQNSWCYFHYRMD